MKRLFFLLLFSFPLFAAPAAKLHIAAPATVYQGVPFDITVKALDASFNVVTDYAGTVHFSTSAHSTAVLPPDYTFTLADQGVHTFSVTMNDGGSSFISAWDGSVGGTAEFTVACNLSVTIHNPGPACPGGTVLLEASANRSDVTWVWQHIPGNAQPAGGPTFNAWAGQWNVTATTADGCSTTATTFVDTWDVPEPVITRPQSVCGNTATATLANASSFTNIQWGVSNGTITSGQGTSSIELTATPEAETGGLWVWVTVYGAASGCRYDTTSYRINVHNDVSAEISTSSAACANATLNASVPDAGAGATYAWTITNGTITNGQGTSSVTYHPSGAANVTLGASVSRGECSDSDTAVVSVNGPTASVNGTFFACDDGVDVPVTLAGAAPFRIVWSDGVVQENITTTTVTRTFEPAQSGTYFVMAVSDASCSGTTSGVASVLAPRRPEIIDEPDSTTIKPGHEATLTVAANGDVREFHWYEGATGDRSKLVAIRFGPTFTTPKLTRTTRYWVEAVNSCTSDVSQTATVTVSTGKHRAARH
ncbi:MAG TPA: hypothetical protein VM733_09065 [Thermoanaerobaculia bacterium]|nr:hypothetical protein [Thermoanaerobaculia bacterium]